MFNAITGAGADADGAGPMASRRDSVVQVTDLVMGLLEFACEMDSSGTLGERLRRMEAVGDGCMMLAEAHDRRDRSQSWVAWLGAVARIGQDRRLALLGQMHPNLVAAPGRAAARRGGLRGFAG